MHLEGVERESTLGVLCTLLLCAQYCSGGLVSVLDYFRILIPPQKALYFILTALSTSVLR